MESNKTSFRFVIAQMLKKQNMGIHILSQINEQTKTNVDFQYTSLPKKDQSHTWMKVHNTTLDCISGKLREFNIDF